MLFSSLWPAAETEALSAGRKTAVKAHLNP